MTKREQVAQILNKALSRSKYSSPYKWVDEYVDQILQVFKQSKRKKKDVH